MDLEVGVQGLFEFSVYLVRNGFHLLRMRTLMLAQLTMGRGVGSASSSSKSSQGPTKGFWAFLNFYSIFLDEPAYFNLVATFVTRRATFTIVTTYSVFLTAPALQPRSKKDPRRYFSYSYYVIYLIFS